MKYVGRRKGGERKGTRGCEGSDTKKEGCV